MPVIEGRSQVVLLLLLDPLLGTGLLMVVESNWFSSYIVLDSFLGTALLLREDPELFSSLL